MDRRCLVITSIARPTGLLRPLAAEARAHDVDLIVVGDQASPDDFELDGGDFYSLEQQRRLDLRLARLCPTGHYARKNIGYLLAMARGADTIVETDDDTVVHPSFWRPPGRARPGRTAAGPGWVNVYRYFSDAPIWPRGFPLDEVGRPVPPLDALPVTQVASPIQQGLIDDDPDVDAVYRLLFELPLRFRDGPSIALAPGAWCPFNSQNTTWWPEAFPLMYLPATCSFRLTDIWRSFVAQRLAWANGWEVLYHAPTISQSRNQHDLMADFRAEVPGYLENQGIRETLERLRFEPGPGRIPGNLRAAYGALVERGLLELRELDLLAAWLDDVGTVTRTPAALSA